MAGKPEKPNQQSGAGGGQPPASSRFKPGQSGNPKGRPKEHANVSEAITRAIARKITVTIAGKRQRISALEAAVRRALQRARPCDLNFFADVTAYYERANAKAEEEAVAEPQGGLLILPEAPTSMDAWEKMYSDKAGARGADGKTRIDRLIEAGAWPPRIP